MCVATTNNNPTPMHLLTLAKSAFTQTRLMSAFRFNGLNNTPQYLFIHVYWTIVIDLGDWRLWVDLSCYVAARGRFSRFFVHVSSCQRVGAKGVSPSSDENTTLVKCGKFKVTRENGELKCC